MEKNIDYSHACLVNQLKQQVKSIQKLHKIAKCKDYVLGLSPSAWLVISTLLSALLYNFLIYLGGKPLTSLLTSFISIGVAYYQLLKVFFPKESWVNRFNDGFYKYVPTALNQGALNFVEASINLHGQLDSDIARFWCEEEISSLKAAIHSIECKGH